MSQIRRKLTVRPRTKLNHIPVWKGSLEGYTTNFLKTNYWRVESSMTYEDAESEAFLVFCKLTAKYSVEEPKHFMALYKTALYNRFNDLANEDSILRNLHSLDLEDSDEHSHHEVAGDLDNHGSVLVSISQAPNEVMQVLRLLLIAPIEILELARNAWKGNGHNVEDGNNFINEALGREKGTDSIGLVRTYFK
jgi:hypothetical protein